MNTSRHFTCTEGTSNKFWSIIVADAKVTTIWGRIGAEGKSKIKVFPSAELAGYFAGKTIASKLDKGYVENSASTI